MSKCQQNKYRPGGRCGGTSAEKQANPEFNASLASLLQQRERQDALFAPAAPQQQQQPQQKTQQSQQFQNQLQLHTKPKASMNDINFLLEGDYEE
jgi:hypothetical protein